MTISEKSWVKYIEDLRKVNETAAKLMMEFMHINRDPDGLWDSPETRQEIINYAYGLSSKYGEAAAELACEMYDAAGALSAVTLPPAVPADMPTYGDIAKAVNGTLKQSANESLVASALARQVKLVSVDTVMHNALRDGAEWAWIPHGETCAFCIMLASRGWQQASSKALRNGHAQHIHANCDCTYAVRFDRNTEVQGYDPQKYLDMYYGDGIDPDILEDIHDEYGLGSPESRLNAMRRQFYRDNRIKIRAQQASAAEKRKELNSSTAEETDVE